MTDQDKVEYWLDLAAYDLETAQALLDSKRYLYVGFMCHQVAEKLLKAFFMAIFRETPPKIHDLRNLATRVGLYPNMPENIQETIALLNPLNIESRYPSYQRQIAASLNYERCTELITLTEELNNWIRQRLSKELGNTPT